jgi:hypothetical protein
VRSFVNNHQRAFENKVSDKNNRELSFAITIDNWICIEDSYNTVLVARNNAIGQLDQKTQDSEQW